MHTSPLGDLTGSPFYGGRSRQGNFGKTVDAMPWVYASQ
jgi:hypothetical protein